jgi:hypothetical protein
MRLCAAATQTVLSTVCLVVAAPDNQKGCVIYLYQKPSALAVLWVVSR